MFRMFRMGPCAWAVVAAVVVVNAVWGQSVVRAVKDAVGRDTYFTGDRAGAASPVHVALPSAPRGTALAALAKLPVHNRLSMVSEDPRKDYDRTRDFGSAWTDSNDDPLGGNGCDTRNDILKRDLDDVSYSGGSCTVAAGRFHDPYTGNHMRFVRGPRSALIQIDHQVSLGNAWTTGAQELTQRQRVDLANDPLNLVASDGSENGKKGDDDASEYLPPNRSFRCRYVANQITVKVKYHLWVTASEKAAMGRVLATCPAQRLSAEPGGAG